MVPVPRVSGSMRVASAVVLVVAMMRVGTHAWTLQPLVNRVAVSGGLRMSSTSVEQSHTTATPSNSVVTVTPQSRSKSSSPSKKKSQTLGLLTFDLDDTLYPIAPVLDEANRAFVRAMEMFGFGDNHIRPKDIVYMARQIREEIAAAGDPVGAAALTHTEVRRRAIRRTMESITLARKLQACADDWATPVASLSPIVVQHARKYVFGSGILETD
jgi:hypothetical protein